MRHPKRTLPPDLRGQLPAIKQALDEVEYKSLKEWEQGFLGDVHPDREIALWQIIATAYTSIVAGATMDPTAKLVVYTLLLGCACNPTRFAASAPMPPLTREQVQAVYDAYYAASKGAVGVPITLSTQIVHR